MSTLRWCRVYYSITMANNIKEVLTGLSGLDLSKYPYQEAMQGISQLGKFGVIKFTLHKGASLMRARPNIGAERFFTRSEYSYKPQQLNTKFQRASTPNGTMFYGSYFPEDLNMDEPIMMPRLIAAMETLPWLRNPATKGIIKVSFSRWIVTEDIDLVAVVGHQKFQEANTYTKELADALNGFMQHHPELKDDTLAIMEFFSNEFGKEQTEEDYRYLLSACFAETVTKKGVDGVLYPSVRVGGKGFNVAFVPAKADTLKLVTAGECTIYKLHDRTAIDNETTIELVNNELSFDLPASAHRAGPDECLKKIGANSLDELLA